MAGTPTLGNYPSLSVSLSGNATVRPDAPPGNATSVNISTDTNFKGVFAASPTTGIVTVTNAYPADTYTVVVTVFGPGGAVPKAFSLTVTLWSKFHQWFRERQRNKRGALSSCCSDRRFQW